jgi:hypothetical protein
MGVIKMARIEIPAKVEYVDDLTGKSVTDAKAVKVSVDGKTGSLDMSAESLAAFVALVTEPNDDNRRALGSLIPRARVASGASNGTVELTMTDGRKVTRAAFESWATEKGHKVNTGRGAQPKDTLAAWITDHPAPAAT